MMMGKRNRGTEKSRKDGRQTSGIMEMQRRLVRLVNTRGAAHKASGYCVFVNIFFLLLTIFCHRREWKRSENTVGKWWKWTHTARIILIVFHPVFLLLLPSGGERKKSREREKAWERHAERQQRRVDMKRERWRQRERKDAAKTVSV